jgi:SAM-dependent methyltransferase
MLIIDTIYNLRKYGKAFFNIIIFEIILSFYFLFKTTKVYKNSKIIDCVPTPYYFLYLLSKQIKNIKIKNIIDIGSGTGRVIMFLKKFNKKSVIGIECNNKAFKYSKQIMPEGKIYLSKIEDYQLNFKEIDMIIVNDTIRGTKFYNLINKIKSSTKIIYFCYINGFHNKYLIKIYKKKIIYNNFNSQNKGMTIYKF